MAKAQDLEHYRSILLAIESLLISIKDVNLKPLSEHNLITNYIHPFVQCLIGSDARTISHYSKAMVDNEDNAFNKRPDYITDVYEEFEFSHPTAFGEIKVESSKDLSKIIDFYRLGIFGKQAIENHNLSGVILFQSIGKYCMKYNNAYSSTNFSSSIGTNITFYCLKAYGGFLNLIEVKTITIPTTKRDITTLVAFLDEMLAITYLYKSIQKTSIDTARLFPSQTLPFMHIQTEKRTLAKTKKPPLGPLSSSAKKS